MTTVSNIALIIGGSSGMGLATAKQLITQGTSIIILGKNIAKLELAKSELTAIAISGAFVEAIQANLYEQQDVDKVVQTVNAEKRHITHLVNAAGYFNPKPFLDHEYYDYDAYATLNRASFFISQAVAQNMSNYGQCGQSKQLKQHHLQHIQWQKLGCTH